MILISPFSTLIVLVRPATRFRSGLLGSIKAPSVTHKTPLLPRNTRLTASYSFDPELRSIERASSHRTIQTLFIESHFERLVVLYLIPASVNNVSREAEHGVKTSSSVTMVTAGEYFRPSTGAVEMIVLL